MINNIKIEIKLNDLININKRIEELQEESSFLAVDTANTLNGIICRLNNGLIEVDSLIKELNEIKATNEIFYTYTSGGHNNEC